jgi:hypothetical protein
MDKSIACAAVLLAAAVAGDEGVDDSSAAATTSRCRQPRIRLPQTGHDQSRDERASRFLSSSVQSNPAMAPSAFVGKNEISAINAVLIPHAGCQYSGW